MSVDERLADLDADVRRAAERLARVPAMLATEEGRDDARAFDPFAGLRRVAGKTTFDTLRAASPPDALLRDALLRWVHELLQARVGHDLVVDDADAVHEVDPALPRRVAEAPEAAGPRTYAEAFGHAIAETDPHRAWGALVRASELAAPVAAVRRERRARRFEAARRLELAHPWALATKATPESLAADARRVLDLTQPLWDEIVRVAAKKTEGPWRATHAMRLAMAPDAREGWPARLVARWLRDVFAALAPRPFDVASLPRALGGASFLRAAYAFGVELRARGAPRSLPFALVRDPYPAPAHVFGAALAIAVAGAPFQRRALGLPSRMATSQSRHLEVALLCALRASAGRLVLLSAEHVDAAVFEEIGARLFGAPLPAPLRDAWPEPRVDAPARFVAHLRAHDFASDLVARFDEDWFRNPNAGRHLASLAAGPAWDGEPAADGAAARAAKALEDRLG